MKTLILVLALTLAPVTASAIPCGDIANLAGTIMKVRQQGIPIHTIMDKLESNFTGDPKLLEVVQIMLEHAYKTPQYRNPSVQRQAITDFQNTYYLECVK